MAGLRRDHIPLLEAAGVTTLTQLAALAPGTPVVGMRPAALAAVTQQARLQCEAVAGEAPPHELLPCEEGRGFALLPEPSAGDVMFDFEGDPFWTPAQGLMFLVGLLLREGDGWRYEAIWAHDRAGEKLAFERLVDLLGARLAEYPDMHVYHYSAAETSEIKRLMAEHATREAEVDNLLRRRAFVDLLTVTRQSLRAGVRSYTLKQTELLAGFERSAAMGSGADAVLGYERWRTSADEAELDAIAAYNEEDCLATLALRDWLLEVRPAGITGPAPVAATEIAEESVAAASERERIRAALTAGQDPRSPRRLAGELLEYHAREARPAYWRWYELQAMDEDELLDDREALAGLEPVGDPVDDGTMHEFVLRYPAQDHKIDSGDWRDHGAGRIVHVGKVDDVARRLVIRRAKTLVDEPLPRALVPKKPHDTSAQRAALLRLALAVDDGDARYRALTDVLARAAPRLSAVAVGAELQTIDLARQRVLARSLDESTLVVQGPPGTGKTWLGARLIVDLLAHDKRVGITAMSHKAINNLLDEVERAAVSDGVPFCGARNASGGWTPPEGAQITIVRGSGATAKCFDPKYDLVAGTTWTFAPECADGQLDYLVIDEAGQLSLADALAAGTSARNLILLGDPLQLPHVSQAVHPAGTSLSVLQHLLGEHATIPGDRGVFLEETRRMHPAVCAFISEEVYESRLHAHPDCSRQAVGGAAGIRHLPVPHLANSSSSPQEAHAIRAEIERLLAQTYRAMDGSERPLTPGDCMVVTPYNAQVRVLTDVLPAGVRIGTVDRFQGQEAPGRLLLDGDLERGGRAAGRRLPVQPQPPQRRWSAAPAASRIWSARRRCSRPARRRSSRCDWSRRCARWPTSRPPFPTPQRPENRSAEPLAHLRAQRADNRYKVRWPLWLHENRCSSHNRGLRAERACSLGARDRRHHAHRADRRPPRRAGLPVRQHGRRRHGAQGPDCRHQAVARGRLARARRASPRASTRRWSSSTSSS